MTVSLSSSSQQLSDTTVLPLTDKAPYPLTRGMPGSNSDWTVIRLIPATETIASALRACRYCPLLEVGPTYIPSYLVDSSFFFNYS